jgi:hypothetical protein
MPKEKRKHGKEKKKRLQSTGGSPDPEIPPEETVSAQRSVR